MRESAGTGTPADLLPPASATRRSLLVAPIAVGAFVMAPIRGTRPHVGVDAAVPAFLIVVFGGVGSFRGAVLAALLVGLVVGLSGAYASEWSLLSMYLVFIAVVTFRAVDLAAHGITVNSVSPGPIATPQTAGLHGPTIRHAVEAAVPLGRYGDAEEVAAATAFLLSDDARFVSGHDLVVDGALTAAAIRYDRARADAETRR